MSSEEETIDQLKEKIELLQQFILESNADPAVPATNNSENDLKIKELERKITVLSRELENSKIKHHNDELKHRLTMQEKLVEIKEAKDKEILNYKNSLASLQAKVYSLQEELAEVES